MDNYIWKLHRYGLSKNIIKTVSSQIDIMFDLIILNKNSELLSKSNRKASVQNAINIVKNNPKVFYELLYEDPYILVQYGAPLIGLRKVVEKANIISIKQLRLMNIDDVNVYMNRDISSTFNKIKESIAKYDANEYNVKTNIKTIVMFNLFISRKIPIVKLVDLLRLLPEEYYDKLNISICEVTECIDELIFSNYIKVHDNTYYFPSNHFYLSEYDEIVEKKFEDTKLNNEAISLLNYLKEDFKDKDILLLRLKKKTLEEIGKLYGMSRERIRQRQKKVLKKMPKIIEIDKYKTIFEEFAFTENEFVSIFNEESAVFVYLSLILKKGQKDSGEYILKSKNIAGSNKLSYLEKHKYYLNRYGEIKRINKHEFTEEVLYKHRDKEFKIEDFLKVYSKETERYPYLDLKVSNAHSILGIASRSQYIINSYGQKFRYFDLTPSTDDLYFKDIVSKLDKGSYSMRKVFNDNQELMALYDIRDEYELHNFFKKREDLLNDNIKLRRTPEFDIGNINKLEFTRNILIEHSNQLLQDCLDYLYEEYGFRKNTMSAYISSKFRQYIDGVRIKYAMVNLNKPEVEIAKSLLVKSLYLKSEALEIFKNADLQMNASLLKHIGYQMKGYIIYKDCFDSVTSALSSIVMKEDIWRRGSNSIDQSDEMTWYLSSMERARKLVVLESGVYAKTSFLEKKGITIDLLDNYVYSIYNFLPQKGYFSLNDSQFSHSLIDYGFENIFYERLISTSELFNPVNRSSPSLFAKEIDSPVTVSKFLGNELVNYENGVDIYDYRDDLKNKYNIDFDIYYIQSHLKKSGYFYSKELQKIYIDKENYLDEVYA